MKWFVLLVALAGSLGVTNVEQRLCEGFLPPNDMKIPVGDTSHPGIRGGGGLTEARYNEIMDRIERIYGPIVQQKGATLKVNRLWKDDTVNASAEQRGNQWIINMYGGLARHPDNTFEGEALVACHEIGHHLGGAPKIASIFGGAWASNEGESDYFATLKCLRLFFAGDDNASIVASTYIDPVARQRCSSQFTSQNDQNLCMRISMSGEAVSYIFQDLRKEKTRPTFGTPDNSQVSRTNDDHPATQCRMDTYLQGTICPVAVSQELSNTDYKVGSCVEGQDPMGFRSRCWFSPDSSGGGGGGGGGGTPGSCPIGDQSMCDQLCKLDPTMPFCKN